MTTTLAIILSILGVYQLAEASLPKGQRLRHRTPDNGSHPQPVVRRLQPEHRRAQKKRGQGGADGQYTVQEEEYFAYCREELTSDDVTADGIISQNEFADKLVDFCGHFMVDNIAGHRCPLNRFSSLDVDLQLVFVFALCPEDDPEDQRVACVNSLRSLDDAGIEFGYIVSPETMTEVAEDVEHLCSGLFSFVFRKLECSYSYSRFASSMFSHASFLCLFQLMMKFPIRQLPWKTLQAPLQMPRPPLPTRPYQILSSRKHRPTTMAKVVDKATARMMYKTVYKEMSKMANKARGRTLNKAMDNQRSKATTKERLAELITQILMAEMLITQMLLNSKVENSLVAMMTTIWLPDESLVSLSQQQFSSFAVSPCSVDAVAPRRRMESH